MLFLPPSCRLLPAWSSSHLHLQVAIEWGIADLPGQQVVCLIGMVSGAKATSGYGELGRSPRRLER